MDQNIPITQIPNVPTPQVLPPIVTPQPTYVKPNLVDPDLKSQLIKGLAPPNKDYWVPTKNFFRDLFDNYIKPNWMLIIFLILIIIFLLYRYRETQNKRRLEKFKETKPEEQFIDEVLKEYILRKELLKEPKFASKYNI